MEFLPVFFRHLHGLHTFAEVGPGPGGGALLGLHGGSSFMVRADGKCPVLGRLPGREPHGVWFYACGADFSP